MKQIFDFFLSRFTNKIEEFDVNLNYQQIQKDEIKTDTTISNDSVEVTAVPDNETSDSLKNSVCSN